MSYAPRHRGSFRVGAHYAGSPRRLPTATPRHDPAVRDILEARAVAALRRADMHTAQSRSFQRAGDTDAAADQEAAAELCRLEAAMTREALATLKVRQ